MKAKPLSVTIVLMVALSILPPATFTPNPHVAAGGDTQPPNVLSFDFAPKIVNTNCPIPIIFTLHLTDDLSGIFASSSVGPVTESWFFSPSGKQSNYFAIYAERDLVSGTRLDGIFQSSTRLARYSETGTWHIVFLTVADQAHNSKTLWESELVARGFPTTFQVNDTVCNDLYLPFVTKPHN